MTASTLVNKWRSRIEACETIRKKLEEDWKINVNFRAGEPFDEAPETDTVFVPTDAALTRQKIASLFSVVPAVSLSPNQPKYNPAAPVFAKRLNHCLNHEVKAHVAMEEGLGDAINASGFCAVKCGYQATFEEVQIPKVDLSMLTPEQKQAAIASGRVPMEKVQRPVYEGFYTNRISPAAFLWPAEFKGSDFEQASFLGWTGELSWPDAKREFKLKDEDKDRVTGEGNAEENTLNEDSDAREMISPDRTVRFHELFYRCSTFDANEKDPRKLKRLVIVDGLDEPAVLEDFQWQRYVPETRQWIGVQGFPIKVLTLTYISDRAIPPSDSKTGRPQVREQMRSRSQMILQRDRSMPLRGYDSNRLDPSVADLIRKGEYQDMIPFNGSPTSAISEISRASYPAEDWSFDRVAKEDLQTAWSMGDNQAGRFATGERSAAEARIVQTASQTLVGFQRAKVSRFFISIAEAVAGLIVLFGLDSQEELLTLGEKADARLSVADLQLLPVNSVFTVKQDATVLLDTQSRQAGLERLLNLAGKSGFLNIESVVGELVNLAGMDPATAMQKPNSPAPESSNVSLRFSGSEDLNNPIVIAMLMKEGKAPGAEEIKAAKILLADALGLGPAPEVTSIPAPQGQLQPGVSSEELSTMDRMPRITQDPTRID